MFCVMYINKVGCSVFSYNKIWLFDVYSLFTVFIYVTSHRKKIWHHSKFGSNSNQCGY